MAESDDFDFINDTNSLNGIRFTIGQSVIPEIIYTIEDDGQDHKVTVAWNEKEHLLLDRDENYDSIKWVINTNIRQNGDTLRLFNKYFGEDEFDSSDEEKRERVIDYMINNFEDEDILHYMGSELSDGRVSYNRDVIKKFFKEGDWKFYDKSLNESNDWGWAEDVPGTKEFAQKYRYFEIVACYGIDYESEECDDEHSHFVKIPKHEADEFWDGEVIDNLDMDILAGPVDDGEGIIMYAIQNRLISHFDINEIIMFEGVRELDKNTYDKLTNYRDSEMVESNDWDWVKDIKPNWGTYYGSIIMKDIEGLPKNLEDVTSEMLSPIWMKIETINRQILTRKNRDTEHDVSETLFESMGQIEWLFGRIMALVDGETDSLVSSRMEPQGYYNSRKLTIISHIKGMTKQLELLGESEEWEWAKEIVSDKTDSKYYIIDKRSQKDWGRLHDKDEWFLIEIVDSDDVTTMWRSYAFNLKDVASWAPSLSISKMSKKEFNNLLGLNSDGTPNPDKIPYWIPHDGDLRDLPKNHNHKKMSELNESSEFKDFNWISKISSDDYEPNTGDHIEIVNQGKPHLFKNWLSPTIWMDYQTGRISNSDGNIEGVVQNNFPVQNEMDNFVVKIKGTKNEYIFLPKRYKIKQNKEKSRDPEWYGLDIVYKPIKISSELREDSNN